MNASIELPRYRCHKHVWALLIAAVTPLPNSFGATLTPANDRYAPFEVPAEYVTKHNPQAGGYYVVYEDGYASYSPSGPFEAGYTLISTSSRAPAQGRLQDIGITIANEGQDSQSVLFARIANEHPEDDPEIVDQVVIEPGQEIRTTLRAGLVVQLATVPEHMEAANDAHVQGTQKG